MEYVTAHECVKLVRQHTKDIGLADLREIAQHYNIERGHAYKILVQLSADGDRSIARPTAEMLKDVGLENAGRKIVHLYRRIDNEFAAGTSGNSE